MTAPAATRLRTPSSAGTLAIGTKPPIEECSRLCAAPLTSDQPWMPHVTGCMIVASDGGEPLVACDLSSYEQCPIGGRRTEGVTPGRPLHETRSPIGEFFAYTASVESSSVLAFRRLRTELRAHGAPRSLLRSMSRAARDERRHARAMGAIARREGVRIAATSCTHRHPRDLEMIALENAVEGCVVETYSALLVRWGAARAREPAIRATLRRVAHDEARHAALAWSIAQWAEARLQRIARDRIEKARSDAFRELRTRVAQAARRELVQAGLVPDACEASRLVDALERHLAPRRLRFGQ